MARVHIEDDIPDDIAVNVKNNCKEVIVQFTYYKSPFSEDGYRFATFPLYYIIEDSKDKEDK